jgi:serine/threonine protein kinase/Flp pilus assembly protein TadD
MVSHYRIVEKIGAGGMGEVYLAEDTELDRKVALKFLPPHLCQDEDCRKRFKREAQAAAKLDHPNIVPVYEVGDFKGRPFFAMAHIEGKSLRQVIKEGKLTVEESVNLTMQICEGLHKAHESGVVHRDIKPGNILIDNEKRVRVVDFGLATVSGEEKLTKTGSTLGTVGYMSPEQVQGKEIDHRSDLFSVGIILYEMLTGRRPFEGDNDAAISRSITDITPEPIERYKSGTTSELQQVIGKALSKDPSLRYQHADGIISDLKRAQLGASVDSLKPQRKMLAVLPFENLGPTEDEYFADGITGEIMSRLAGIQELGVIARTSSIQYKGTEKSIQQISEELGVDYILEGTIRWQKRSDKPDLVRITPQLIQTSDATDLWAENYDRELAEIFEVQTDIANHIIAQLRISLLSDEKNGVKRQPTESLEAYNYYLRGRYYLLEQDWTKSNLTIAIQMFQNAIACDLEFIDAYTYLARAYLTLYSQREQLDEHRNLAKQAIDKALAMHSGSSAVYVALGSYYSVLGEFEKALEAFELGMQADGNSIDCNLGVARAWRRMGRFEQSIDLFKHVFQMSPRDAKLAWDIGWTYVDMRQYDKAEQFYNRSMSLAPDQISILDHLAWHIFLRKGDTHKALGVLKTVPEDNEYYDMIPYYQVRLKICERDYTEALEILKKAPERLCSHRWDQHYRPPRSFLVGLLFWIKGDYQQARGSFDSAIEILESDIRKNPKSIRNRSSLGIAYAGTGRKEEAIHEGKQAVDNLPISKDALSGALPIFDLILIYMMVGEYDLALDRVEQLLIHPCDEFSTVTMRIDPIWDPLRDHPRFQALIEKYEKIHGI